MLLLGLLEVCVNAAAIFKLKRSAFDHFVWRILENPHIAISMLTTILAENRSKKEMLERNWVFFSRPKFRN